VRANGNLATWKHEDGKKEKSRGVLTLAITLPLNNGAHENFDWAYISERYFALRIIFQTPQGLVCNRFAQTFPVV
jgi:hypothetical protein